MEITSSIKKLRIMALLLFVTPTIAILGTLLIHNYLVSYKFTKNVNFNFQENIPGISVEILCSKENQYCKNIKFEKFNTLKECYKNEVIENHVTENGNEIEKNVKLKEFKNFNEKIYYKVELSDKLNKNCILNSKSINFYNIFPLFYETIYNLKNHKKTMLGTSNTVNPFINGETSISNIAKRFPVNIIFKTLLYFSIIFMFFYWTYYNRVFKDLQHSNKNNLFFLFGILSAFFLLLHVFFLGSKFEFDFLNKLRRTFVVFFILFEILAQAFLIRKIFFVKDKIKDYINYIFIYLKLSFVLLICSVTLIILLILMFYNLESKVDYILEWNYFLILLIFYFLSFLMWKKTN